MVNFAIHALATLAVAALAGATPTPVTERAELFSFARWVDGIVANPDGDNLSPEEAIEAWKASANETSAIDKRWTCRTVPGTEAYVPDAVACINDLARRGGMCGTSGTSNFCVIGNARVWGNKIRGVSTSSTCNDVARGAGIVMDHCTWSDNTVQGSEFAWGNGDLLVYVTKP